MAPTVVLDLGLLRDAGAEWLVEPSLPAFALIFCLATEHSDANSSEIRANAFSLAASHRAFIFPYGLIGLTIWNVKISQDAIG